MKKKQKILATIISLVVITFFVCPVQAEVCEGYYVIDDVDTSGDIAALSGCTEITVDLYVDFSSLTSLSGLENLTSIGRNLAISHNNSLTSLSGLENLTSIGGDLYIEENDNLTSLNGLQGLTNLSGGFEVISNGALTSLNGLQGLTNLSGSLKIMSNGALTSLSGLQNLTSVGGYLYILEFDLLTNLCALYNVNLDGNLYIYNNLLLSMDTAYALETQLRSNGFTGTANIHDNDGTVQVFCDNDNDTVYDDIDNCPNIGNLNQEDADLDGIGDACDNDTLYGTVSGDADAGIDVGLYRPNCGGAIWVATDTTDVNGYYSFGNLPNGWHHVIPEDDGYTFTPVIDHAKIPQAVIQSYDFTATPSIIGSWGPLGLIFYVDGSFEVEGVVQGTYEISGNQISFIDDGCGTVEGFYTYSINENTLSLVLISDNCFGRTLVLPGDYERQ